MKGKILFGICLLACTSVVAQDTTLLNEVIVTATKAPIKQSQTGKVVNVITQEDIKRNAGKTLPEMLNQLPGIVINGADNNPGTNQTVYTRGASSSNTLILLNGMPLYDASGIGNEFDLNNFALDNIERIEVLKGSQSTLYGSDAVAGVINIITKKESKEPFNVAVNLSAGSYETYKGSVALSGSGSKGETYFVSYNKMNSKGFSSAYDSTHNSGFDKDGFDQDAFFATVGFVPFKKTSLHLFGKYNSNKADIDAGAFADDKDYKYHNKNTVTGFYMDYKLNNGFVRLQYSYDHVLRTFTDDSTDVGGFAKYQYGKYAGNSHFAEIYSSINLSKNVEFLSGIDYRRNNTSQTYNYISAFGPGSSDLSADSAKTDQYSVYASVNLKSKSGFNMEIGSRWNHHSIYGSNYTSSLNPFFLIKNKYKIYASIASGYRVPSLYQLYSEYGNKKLKPESTTSYEVGGQYFSDKINTGITGFIRNGKDVFLFYSQSVPPYSSYYLNGDKQHDYGVEFQFSYAINSKLKASVNYTFVKGEITTANGNAKDTSFYNLYKRPEHVVNASISYQPLKQLFISANLRTASKSFEPQYLAAPFELKGYYTLGLNAQYDVIKSLSLYVNMQNITDQNYFVTRGFTTKGFNFMGGLKWSFN